MNGLTATVLIIAILATPLSVGIVEYFHRRCHCGYGRIGDYDRLSVERIMLVRSVLTGHSWQYLAGLHGHTHSFTDKDVVTNGILMNELAGHVGTDHANLATNGQIEALQRQIDRQEEQIRTLMRQNRRLRIRIISQFPFEVIGFVLGALVGFIVDRFIPKHYYQFKSLTNVFVNGKLVRIHDVTNTDVLKLYGIALAFAMLGFMIGLVVKYALGETRQVEVEGPDEVQQVEQP